MNLVQSDDAMRPLTLLWSLTHFLLSSSWEYIGFVVTGAGRADVVDIMHRMARDAEMRKALLEIILCVLVWVC